MSARPRRAWLSLVLLDLRVVPVSLVVPVLLLMGAPACAPNSPGPQGPSTIPDDGPPPDPAADTFVAPEPLRTLEGCEVFPADTVFHADVRLLPVHPRSQAWIDGIGADAPFVLPTVPPDDNPLSPARYGDPINLASADTPRVLVEYNGVYPIEKQYTGPLPHPAGFVIEDGFDQHTMVLEHDECASYELIGATNFFDVLRALGGARWSLDARTYNDELEAVTAPRLPLVGTVLRVDEIVAGHIDHALKFVVPTTSPEVLWPAARSDGQHTGTHSIPMGAWLRLKSSVDIEDFPRSVRVVAEALQVHGAILLDTGGVEGSIIADVERGLFVDAVGAPVERELASIRDLLRLDDFEFVDATIMQVATDSLRVR